MGGGALALPMHTIDRVAEAAAEGVVMDDDNLLVSCCSRAPGRARHEILARLRALGDEAPTLAPTGVKGLFGVRTTLDPRRAILELRALCERSPRSFRYTFKWIPVDAWTAKDLEAMKQAVIGLRDRIEANETWRMTVERRVGGALDPAAVITALAAIIPARVNLTRPDKILHVELFTDRVALAVLAPTDVFSVVKTLAARPVAGPPSPAAASGATA